MNELQIFEHPKFGKIRTIVENGKTLFCGVDTATALEYKDTTNAIKRHCRGVVKRYLTDNLGTERRFFQGPHPVRMHLDAGGIQTYHSYLDWNDSQLL